MAEMPTFVKKLEQEIEDARKAAQEPTPEVPAVETPQEPAVEAVPTEPEAAPQDVAEPEAKQTPEPEVEDEGKTDLAPQSTEKLDEQLRLMEHKFSVLQGKYNKEVTPALRRIRELEAENMALREQTEAVKAAPAPAKTPTKPKRRTADDVSDDEVKEQVKASLIEDYGMDFWKQQIALQQTVQAPAPVDDERVQRIEAQLDQQRLDTFYDQLDGVVPNWREIDESTAWTEEFLEESEPLTGVTYGTLLADAFQKRDVIRTAELFRRFTGRQRGTKATVNPTAGREVPRPGPANNGPMTTKKPMTLDEYTERMSKLPTLGLSPRQLVERAKELDAAFREGQMVDG